jgi:hypothetical protein
LGREKVGVDRADGVEDAFAQDFAGFVASVALECLGEDVAHALVAEHPEAFLGGALGGAERFVVMEDGFEVRVA